MNIFNMSIVAAYLVLNLVIGVWAGRNSKGFEHFSVGHRNFSSFLIFCTLSASFIGGGFTIGNAGKVYSSGMIYAFALLGFSLKEILVALIIAPKMQNYKNYFSVGDIVGKAYGKAPQVVTGIFSVLVCAGILGAQITALETVFEIFFPQLNSTVCTLVSYIVILAYCALGGMRAVVYTDVLQFFLLAIGLPLIFFIGLHAIGGWHVIVEHVPHDHILPFTGTTQIYTLIGLFIAFMFGEILVPPYVQRLFMTDPKSTRLGVLASGLFSIPFFLIVGAIGLIAYVAAPDLNPNLALPYVLLHFAPVYLRGILVAAIVAVVMSSASGFLNAAAVAFTNDLVKTMTPNRFSDKQLLRIAKIVTVIVGLSSILFAMGFKNALDVLLFSYNLWSPIVLVPLLAAIFGVRANALHCLLGGLSGFAAAMLWLHYTQDALFLTSAPFGILVNLLFFFGSRALLPTRSK